MRDARPRTVRGMHAAGEVSQCGGGGDGPIPTAIFASHGRYTCVMLTAVDFWKWPHACSEARGARAEFGMTMLHEAPGAWSSVVGRRR